MARRHGTRSGRVALALFVASSACVVPARAQTTSEPAQQPARPVVVFVRVGDDADAASFDGMQAQLRELSVEVVAAPPMGKVTLASQAFRAAELARSHSALGTIWFGQDERAQLRVFVYDAKHRQLASRTLSRPDAAVREELAVVLRSAISALLAGEATALEPVTIPAPAPALPPVPPARPQQRAQLLLGLGYAGTTYASGTFQNGLQLLVVGELSSRVLVGFDGIWWQPTTLAGGGAAAVLDRYPGELFAGYAFAESPRFRAFVEAGFQLELVRRTTRVSDSRLYAEPAENRLRFALSPRLRTLFEPSKRWLVFAAFGADITTDRFDYVVESASGPLRLAARSVRPRLEAGVAVYLW